MLAMRITLGLGLSILLLVALSACRPFGEQRTGADIGPTLAKPAPAAADAGTDDRSGARDDATAADGAGAHKSALQGKDNGVASARNDAPTSVSAGRSGGAAKATTTLVKQEPKRRPSGDWAKMMRAHLDRPTDFAKLTAELKRRQKLATGLDETAMRAELEKRAVAGDAEAALALGLMLRYGEAAPDKAQGEKLIAAAAETGSARAMAELGRILLADETRADGPAQAEAWLRKALAAGESEGAFLLASAQRLGMLEPAAGEVPNELMLAAAELGNDSARRLFIRAAAKGDREEATPEQVTRWSEELAKTGDLEGMERWALQLKKTGEHAAAIEWFQRAAAAGSTVSAVVLANYGIGDESAQLGAINHLREQIAVGGTESVTARRFLAFLLSYQPQTNAVRAEILGGLREAGAQHDYRASLTADLIEGGASARDAFCQLLALSDEEVYRRIAEERRQELADGAGGDSRPPLLDAVAPAYPSELLAAKMDGMVTVQFFVEEDGTVADLHVISSDHPAFSAAALEALARWRFRPGIKEGKPVATRMQIGVPFTMRK